MILPTIRKTQDMVVVIKVSCEKKVNSFEKKREWIKLQVLPSLFMFVAVYGEKHLLDMLDAQQGKLSDIQRKMLNKYLYETDDNLDFV